MTGMTIEWAPFTLVEGTPEETLLAASEALQTDFLARGLCVFFCSFANSARLS